MDFKYKVRFFNDYMEMCFAQFKDSVIPQINSEVYINNTSYFVDNITYDYGDGTELKKFILVDVLVSNSDK